MAVEGVVRIRCLAVAAALTVAACGATAVLARALTADLGAPTTVDGSLVRLCLVALLATVAWGWLQGLAAVLEAWRGSVASGRSGAVRRVVLAACGFAVVGMLTAQPADAAFGHPGPDALTGLPLPERAVGPARATGRVVAVRSGHTLWALAAAELPPHASAADITDRWQLIYRHNRGVIGADPDLIRPGQLLRLPHLTTREPT
jgi:hypothetical protein